MLAVLSIATGALAFSAVVLGQWGVRSRLASRTFAVVSAGLVVSAAFPFALGAAFGLLALWALQERRHGRFVVCALLTLAASPLGFAFLVVALVGAAFARRTLRDSRIQIAVIGGCIAAELVLWRLFGDGGHFPYGLLQLVPSLLFGVVGLIVTRGVPEHGSCAGSSGPTSACCLVAYVVPTAVGSNLERLRYVALPLAFLAAALRGWRPLWLVVPAAALAAIWSTTPIFSTLARASTDPEASPAYWQPAVAYFHTKPEPVVPRRGRRHRRALARRVPARRRDPDRPRLVPPERLPAERAPLRLEARRHGVPRLAAEDGRPLRRSSPTRRPTTARAARPNSSAPGKSGLVPVRSSGT